MIIFAYKWFDQKCGNWNENHLALLVEYFEPETVQPLPKLLKLKNVQGLLVSIFELFGKNRLSPVQSRFNETTESRWYYFSRQKRWLNLNSKNQSIKKTKK